MGKTSSMSCVRSLIHASRLRFVTIRSQGLFFALSFMLCGPNRSILASKTMHLFNCRFPHQNYDNVSTIDLRCVVLQALYGLVSRRSGKFALLARGILCRYGAF